MVVEIAGEDLDLARHVEGGVDNEQFLWYNVYNGRREVYLSGARRMEKFREFPLQTAKRWRGWWVYILYEEDEPVYVGMTHRLVRRVKDHKARRRIDPHFCFDSAAVKRVWSESEAEAEERRLIRRLNPEHNVQHRDPESYIKIDILAVLNIPKPAEVKLERRV